MKTLTYISLLWVMGLICLQSEVRGQSTTLPFPDGFEAYSAGTAPFAPGTPSSYWSTNTAGGTATIVTDPATLLTASGSNYCTVTNLTLTLSIANNNYTNSFVRFYTQPVFYDDNNGSAYPSATTGVSAAFYFGTDGCLRAYTYISAGSTNIWTNLNPSVSVPTNNIWIGLMVNVKYAASNYDVWMSTNGYRGGASPTQPFSWMGTLTMPSGATNQLSQVSFQNTFNLDDVAVFGLTPLTVNFPVGPSGSATFNGQSIASGFITNLLYGATVTNMMVGPSPYTVGGTQNVYNGWLLAGNMDTNNASSGSSTSTNVTLSITNTTTLTWNWITNYLLTATINDLTFGQSITISPTAPGGWYGSGSSVTLTPVPVFNSTYHGHFTNWTGTLASSANPLNLTMSQAYTEQANFFSDGNTLTIVNPAGYGYPASAVGTYTYNWGSYLTETISGSPTNNGGTQYVSTGWAMPLNADTNGAYAAYAGSITNVTLKLTNNATLTWNWTTNYMFTATTNGAAYGTIGGATSGWYVIGSSVTVTALPSFTPGVVKGLFVNWTGTAPSNDTSVALTMNHAYGEVANFVSASNTLTIISPYAGAAAVPTASPGSGTHHIYNYAASIPISIGLHDATTQHSCIGWVMASNAPVSGTTTNFTIASLTNDATLTWHWTSNSVIVLNSPNPTSMWGILSGVYNPPQNTLAGQQGLDLASGFLNGEALDIWSTNGVFNRYVLVGGVWVGGPLSPANVQLGGGVAIVVERVNNTPRSFTYNYSGSGSGQISSNLAGVATIQNGWNFLAWPYQTAASTGNWGIPAHVNDRIFLLDGTSGRIWWNGAQWMKGSVPLSYTLQPGQQFWYWNGGATIQWQPVNPNPAD